MRKKNGRLFLTCYDPSIMEEVYLRAPIGRSSARNDPRENEELADLLKVPRTNEGFFLEAHMKLRPVDFASDGIYLCGLAHSPKNIRETHNPGRGGGCKGVHDTLQREDAGWRRCGRCPGEKCAACLTCVRVCPYHVPVINEKGEAEIDMSKCKGCGTCAAECPAKAIDLMHYRDVQIVEKAGALVAQGAR